MSRALNENGPAAAYATRPGPDDFQSCSPGVLYRLPISDASRHSADDPTTVSDCRETAIRVSGEPSSVGLSSGGLGLTAAPRAGGALGNCPVDSCLRSSVRCSCRLPELSFASLRRLAGRRFGAKTILADDRFRDISNVPPTCRCVNLCMAFREKCDRRRKAAAPAPRPRRRSDVRSAFDLCSFHLPPRPKGG